MKRKAKQDLSAGQLQIMNLVWDRGEVSVAEVWEEINRKRPVARNTVQTILSRLASKGWLKYRQEGNAFYYSAAVPRKRVIGGMVGRLVQAAFGGSASGLVLTLLEDADLSEEEAERIREMIDRARGNRGKSAARGKEKR